MIIQYGNSLNRAKWINKIVALTIFNKQNVIFFNPALDCFLLVFSMVLCIPSHKIVESYFGLGKKEKYVKSMKPALIIFAIPLTYILVLEVYYFTYLEPVIHFRLYGDHPLRDAKKFFAFSCNEIWI